MNSPLILCDMGEGGPQNVFVFAIFFEISETLDDDIFGRDKISTNGKRFSAWSSLQFNVR